jgi:hypothetical protein
MEISVFHKKLKEKTHIAVMQIYDMECIGWYAKAN